MTNLFEDGLQSGDATQFGAVTNDPDIIELFPRLGFSWVLIDQMFTANDWGRTENLLRSAKASGVAGMVRVMSNPWIGGRDRRIAVEVSRAIGVGAEYVQVSAGCMEELEDCVRLSEDWHQKPIHLHPFDSPEDWNDQPASLPTVIPQLESAVLLREIEKVVELPGIRFVQFAMTDSSRDLAGTRSPDWELPELWNIVGRAVESGKARGVTIGANISYAYNSDELARRVAQLRDVGVKVIMLQTTSFLFQVVVGEMMKSLGS